MALTLGESNSSFYKSLQYLNNTRAQIDKSQLRLSSGNKIVSPADDAGGLSVAMKLQHQLVTTNAMVSNVSNAVSYAEMQHSTIETASSIISEMESLKIKYDNATGDPTEQAIYQASFDELLSQVKSITAETINGEPLFNNRTSIYTSSTGSFIVMEAISVGSGISSQSGFDATKAVDFDDLNRGLSDANISASLTTISGKLSNYQIQAASDLSSLGFASDYLSNMATNIEAAHGRIMDVDIAEETINLSKLTLQHEAALAAIVQANLAMESVLELLISRND
jgi:flagellin